MRVRGVLVVGLVCALVSGSNAAGAASEQVVTAAGTTVLTGTESNTVRLRVPSDAFIDVTPVADAQGRLSPKGMQAEGGEGFVGFLLTSDDYRGDGLYVAAARLPVPMREGEGTVAGIGQGQPALADRTESELPALGEEPPARCQRCRIPAGDYRLQLITDYEGAPARVSITFEGLSGTTQVAPTAHPDPHPYGTDTRFERPARDATDLWVSGHMSSGVWFVFGDEMDGVLLTVSGMEIDLADVPVGVLTLETCRRAGESPEQCERTSVGAGTDIDTARAGSMAGTGVTQADVSQSYEFIGQGTYAGVLQMLWIPTGPSGDGQPQVTATGSAALGTTTVVND